MPLSYFNRSRRYNKRAPVVWYKDFPLLLKLLPPTFLLVVASSLLLILSFDTNMPNLQTSATDTPPNINATSSVAPSDPSVIPSDVTSSEPSVSSDPFTSSTASSDVVPVTPQTELDWNLILVNTEHPLPDDFSPELSQFGPGQARCDSRIKQNIEQMLKDASNAGYNVAVLSDYRTIEKQTELFEKKVANVMKNNPDMSRAEAEVEAAKTVAYPGTSEHHTGLAFDIASEGNYDLTERFAKTESYEWLKKHCSDYGFIIRYPEDKVAFTGIIYEPWHYRYVGRENAKEIERLGFCLEEYVEYLKSSGSSSASQIPL